MNIRRRLGREVIKTGGIFLVFIVVVSILFFQFNSSLHQLINESNPALETMEHILTDIYRDSVFLPNYLMKTNIEDTLELDVELEAFDQYCSIVKSDAESMIEMGPNSADKQLAEDFRIAVALHDAVLGTRNEIITLHKQELTQSVDRREEKAALQIAYSTKLEGAIDTITASVDRLNARNKALHDQIMVQSQTYFIAIIVMIALFVAILVYQVRKIACQIITPVDTMIQTTQEFVDGKYDARLEQMEELVELNDLQNNINNVFNVVQDQTVRSKKEQEKVQAQLLRKEYVDILQYLNQNALQHRRVTITSLKKYLHITHPTVLARIRFLEQKGYIVIEKDGREKFLVPTKKAHNF